MDKTVDNWKTYFETKWPALVLFARQFAPTLTDAEDSVQDGFLRFWQSRHKAIDPTAYLYACVRSAALNQARGERRCRLREARIAQERQVQAWFESPLDMRDFQNTIQQALADLPLEQREVLVLKIWGELTFAQIAAMHEISVNTAASRYRYALDSLRKRLGEEQLP